MDNQSIGRYIKSGSTVTFALAPGETSEYDIGSWSWNIDVPSPPYQADLAFRSAQSRDVVTLLSSIGWVGCSSQYTDGNPL